jgi:hypothetical protein
MPAGGAAHKTRNYTVKTVKQKERHMSKLVEIVLDTSEIKYCGSMAKLSQIGGKSSVRTHDRTSALIVDQLVGQLGEYALSIYLFGEPSRYYIQRMSSNLNPRIGDNGQDILGCNLDVKTSLMRASPDPFMYRLAVRPNELHPNHVFVLALVKPNDEGQILFDVPIFVYLIGWASSSMFTKEPNGIGPFLGAHIINASELKELPPIRWNWREIN